MGDNEPCPDCSAVREYGYRGCPLHVDVDGWQHNEQLAARRPGDGAELWRRLVQRDARYTSIE